MRKKKRKKDKQYEKARVSITMTETEYIMTGACLYVREKEPLEKMKENDLEEEEDEENKRERQKDIQSITLSPLHAKQAIMEIAELMMDTVN